MILSVKLESDESQEHRRSTRVPLEVSIEVEGETNRTSMKGATVVVNLHGALIRTSEPLHEQSRIRITVYLTGKSSAARVVHVSPEMPLQCGIELEHPQNIWGVQLPPEDWEDEVR